MSQSQIQELMQSGFSRDEAMQALNLSNNETQILPNLLDYMKQIESDMLKLNKFSQQYKNTIESKLKSIHDESLSYQQLIQQKEKELTSKIEHQRDILQSQLITKKEKYIDLTSKLKQIKQSLDTSDANQNHAHNLSFIKQEIDQITTDNMQLLQSFNNNTLNTNNNWYKIKENIHLSDINSSDNDEKKQKDSNNILCIDLMTFNIRNSLLDKEYSRLWSENRRKLTANMLYKYGPPTIIATQEGVINQLIDIQHDLPIHYTNIGNGRLLKEWYNSSNDRMNEHCKIYWNNNTLKVIDYGTFQLKRPKDAPLPRVATWGLYDFKGFNIKYGLLIVNTHLSYKTEEIRIVQLKHLMEFVVEMMKNYKRLYSKELYYKELLIFIVGDFNSNNRNGSKLYDYLFDNGIDECIINGIKINEYFIDCTNYVNLNCKYTFHAFNGMKCRNKNGFIDWIICSKNVINSNAVRLKQINVVTEHEFNEGLPSDHYPVVLKFDIDTTKCQMPKQTECVMQ